MRKQSFLAVAFFSMFFVQTQAAVSPPQAKAFIQSLISEGILYWKDKPYADQISKFKEIMEVKFDLDGIAKRVIGDRLWGYMDIKQREAYLNSFRQMLLNRYSAKFSNYGGQSIVVVDAAASVKSFPIGVNSNKPEPQIVVTSELHNSGGSPVKVEWYVGEENGRPTITDITLAGPSMVATEQATFTAIQRNPQNLKNARDFCKNAGVGTNKCIGDKLTEEVMKYMLSAH